MAQYSGLFSYTLRNFYFKMSLVPLANRGGKSKQLSLPLICTILISYAAFIINFQKEWVFLPPEVSSRTKYLLDINFVYCALNLVSHLNLVRNRAGICQTLNTSESLRHITSVSTKANLFLEGLKALWLLAVVIADFSIKYIYELGFYLESTCDLPKIIFMISTLIQLPLKFKHWALRYSFVVENLMEIELINCLSKRLIINWKCPSGSRTVLPTVEEDLESNPGSSSLDPLCYRVNVRRTLSKIYRDIKALHLLHMELFYPQIFYEMTMFAYYFLLSTSAANSLTRMVSVIAVVADSFTAITIFVTSVLAKYKHYKLIVTSTKEVYKCSDKKSQIVLRRFVSTGKDDYGNSPCVFLELGLEFLSEILSTIALIATTVFWT